MSLNISLKPDHLESQNKMPKISKTSSAPFRKLMLKSPQRITGHALSGGQEVESGQDPSVDLAFNAVLQKFKSVLALAADQLRLHTFEHVMQHLVLVLVPYVCVCVYVCMLVISYCNVM